MKYRVRQENSSASGSRSKRLWERLDFRPDIYPDGSFRSDGQVGPYYLHVPTKDKDSTHRVRYEGPTRGMSLWVQRANKPGRDSDGRRYKACDWLWVLTRKDRK